jgi:hypothetical protein
VKGGDLRNPAIAAFATVVGVGIGLALPAAGIVLAPAVGIALIVVPGVALLATLTRGNAEGADRETVAAESLWLEFGRELRRARRNGHPLTLVRIPIAGEGEPSGDGAVALAERSRLIGRHLRLIDRAWADGDSIYLLMPESSRAAANIALDRVRAIEPGLLPLEFGLASFPGDGLTSGAILAAVQDTGTGQETPTPIRPVLLDTTEPQPHELDGERVVSDAGRQ